MDSLGDILVAGFLPVAITAISYAGMIAGAVVIQELCRLGVWKLHAWVLFAQHALSSCLHLAHMHTLICIIACSQDDLPSASQPCTRSRAPFCSARPPVSVAGLVSCGLTQTLPECMQCCVQYMSLSSSISISATFSCVSISSIVHQLPDFCPSLSLSLYPSFCRRAA